MCGIYKYLYKIMAILTDSHYFLTHSHVCPLKIVDGLYKFNN